MAIDNFDSLHPKKTEDKKERDPGLPEELPEVLVSSKKDKKLDFEPKIGRDDFKTEEADGFWNLKPEKPKIFHRIAEGMGNAFHNAQEKVGRTSLYIKTIDKAKAMWSDKLLEKHEIRSVGLVERIKGFEQELKIREGMMAKEKTHLEEFRSKYGEHLKADEMSGLGKEVFRRELEIKKIQDKLKGSIDEATTELKYDNDKKRIFESKRQIIVDKVGEKIKERARPPEREAEFLAGRRKELDGQVAQFIGAKNALESEMKSVESDLSKAIFKDEKLFCKRTIADFKNELRRVDKNINSCQFHKFNIETRLAVAEKRVNKWKNLSEAFTRIGERQIGYQEVSKDKKPAANKKEKTPRKPARKKEESDKYNLDWEGYRSETSDERDNKIVDWDDIRGHRIEENVKPEVIPASVADDQVIAPETVAKNAPRQEEETPENHKDKIETKPESIGFDLKEYLNRWNRYSERNLRIDFTSLVKKLGISPDLAASKINIQMLEGFIRGYLSRTINPEELDPSNSVTLKRRFKDIRKEFGVKEKL